MNADCEKFIPQVNKSNEYDQLSRMYELFDFVIAFYSERIFINRFYATHLPLPPPPQPFNAPI